MAKKSRERPFNPGALKKYAASDLSARIGAGSPVNRYTIVVPIEQIRPTRKAKATAQDLEELEQLLILRFRGITTPPAFAGYGLRGTSQAGEEPEMNFNTSLLSMQRPFARQKPSFKRFARNWSRHWTKGLS
jgi:hypothetical protein